MKCFFLIVFSFLAASSFSQKIDTISISSSVLNEQRKLIVYTPGSYVYDSSKKYEVIYVFDAQARMIFDMATATVLAP